MQQRWHICLSVVSLTATSGKDTNSHEQRLQGEETMDRAWRGAEAYHLWLLAHRQLYSGAQRAGLRTALNLRRYADVLPQRSIYALLALLSLCAGFYGQCSRALMKLETIAAEGGGSGAGSGFDRVLADGFGSAGTVGEQETLAELAAAIFTRHPPAVSTVPSRR